MEVRAQLHLRVRRRARRSSPRRVWGINLEQLPGGARLVCEFPAGMVPAKEVVTTLLYYSVPAPGWREPCGWVND
jgi:hypothetical protein